jgi:hypothetical protein
MDFGEALEALKGGECAAMWIEALVSELNREHADFGHCMGCCEHIGWALGLWSAP